MGIHQHSLFYNCLYFISQKVNISLIFIDRSPNTDKCFAEIVLEKKVIRTLNEVSDIFFVSWEEIFKMEFSNDVKESKPGIWLIEIDVKVIMIYEMDD